MLQEFRRIRIAQIVGSLLLGAMVVAAGAHAASPPTAPAAPAAAGAPTAEIRRVVLVMGTDPALPAMREHVDAFRAALQAGMGGSVTFFTETLDALRFDYAGLAPEMLALLRKKYAAQRVDLVVGVADGSIDFIRDHHAELWPGAPVLLSAVDEASVDRQRLPAGATALLWRVDIDGTLNLIQALQPGATRLIVVGGSADADRALAARVAARAGARTRWQLESWTGDSIDALRGRLSALDAGSAVFFTNLNRDADGRAIFPVDALALLSAASGAPIYGLYGTFIGCGAAAGSVIDFAESGRRAAAQATAQWQGRQGAIGALTLPAPGHCVADYRQLSALGLSPARLPPGCELRNPPRNLWTEYRSAVLLAGAVLLLQALTISALLLQRRQRRRAEAESLQRRTELSRAMRFAAMGELTASIAHEINQPLGAILANADAAELMLQSGATTTAQLREILGDIRRDDMRAHEVIRRLRALLEKNDVEQVEMRLHPTLDDALALLQPEAQRRGIDLQVRLSAADDRLLGDRVQLQQVLLNLALNAMDAMAANPPDARQLDIGSAEGGDDELVLTVADRGPGIAAGQREAVFASFYTTKPRGLGLGLSIVRAIVAAHLGSVSVAGREGGGAVFSVSLPRRLGVGMRSEATAATAGVVA